MCRYSPSSLYVELSRNHQPWFPPKHLSWSNTPIIFNGAEIRKASGSRVAGGRHKLQRWPNTGSCGLLPLPPPPPAPEERWMMTRSRGRDSGRSEVSRRCFTCQRKQTVMDGCRWMKQGEMWGGKTRNKKWRQEEERSEGWGVRGLGPSGSCSGCNLTSQSS